MSQYQQSPGQLKYLKGMYAKLAEDKATQENWDTPYDEGMSIADARKAVQSERRRFKLGLDSKEENPDGSNSEDSTEG